MRVVALEEKGFVTYGPNKLFDVTEYVGEIAAKVEKGFVAVLCKGSTGALLVLPREKEVIEECERGLWSLVPIYGWRHPGNAYAHLRSTLIGTSIIVAVEKGGLVLPKGSGVFFLENQAVNARRRKIVLIAVESEG